jgi:hypothetical protein
MLSTTTALPPHPSAINSNHLTTNIRTRRTRQKNYHALEIPRIPPPTGRYPSQNTLRTLLILQQRLIHIRRYIPRRNRINTNSLTRPLITQRLSQLPYPTLGRRIRRHRDAALERQQRRDIDDSAATAQGQRRRRREHVRADVPAQREDGRQVHLQHGVPVGVGEDVRRVPPLDAAAVEQDVDAVAVGEDLRRQGCEAGR